MHHITDMVGSGSHAAEADPRRLGVPPLGVLTFPPPKVLSFIVSCFLDCAGGVCWVERDVRVCACCGRRVEVYTTDPPVRDHFLEIYSFRNRAGRGQKDC